MCRAPDFVLTYCGGLMKLARMGMASRKEDGPNSGDATSGRV